MNTTVIDVLTSPPVEEAYTTATLSVSQSGLRSPEGDILQVVIRERCTPQAMARLLHKLPPHPVGSATTSRVIKDYMLSLDPFVLKSK